jgi:hypothetical protein
MSDVDVGKVVAGYVQLFVAAAASGLAAQAAL